MTLVAGLGFSSCFTATLMINVHELVLNSYHTCAVSRNAVVRIEFNMRRSFLRLEDATK